MRTFTVCAASVGLAALGACSDGTGLIPETGGSGNNSSPTPSGGQVTGTAGTSVVPSGGSSSTTAGTGSVITGGSELGSGGSGAQSGGPGSAGSSNPGGGTGSDTGGGGSAPVDPYSGPFKILVLHTTLDFPHDSVPICDLMVGVESRRAEVEADRKHALPPNLGATPDAMMPAGTKPGSQWTADVASDDLSQFTEENLKNYALIFSCNPTGTVFSANPKVKDKAAAMAAFQRFVEGGGAWAGVHSATDFEKTNGFPWFTNTLVGAYFDHHDNDGTSGTVQFQAMFANHPVAKGMQTTWSTQDEWYYMNRDVSGQPGFQILARLASDNRPVAWVKELGTNGRMFYTIRGHNKSVYEEPDFRKLVLNGILWATHRLN